MTDGLLDTRQSGSLSVVIVIVCHQAPYNIVNVAMHTGTEASLDSLRCFSGCDDSACISPHEQVDLCMGPWHPSRMPTVPND